MIEVYPKGAKRPIFKSGQMSPAIQRAVNLSIAGGGKAYIVRGQTSTVEIRAKDVT